MVRIASHLENATFINRENRFVGTFKKGSQIEKCHILNPGRMIKFLVPGAQILVENRKNPKRKLDYSLLYVKHPKSLILIDSQTPNEIVYEGLKENQIEAFSAVRKIIREYPYGQAKKSRVDFLLDNQIYLEVKATNYEEHGIGYFPDAPTKRGQKHLRELIEIQKSQSEKSSAILFLSQRTDIKEIRPFDKIDPEFGQLLRTAAEKGVLLLGYSILFEQGGKIAKIGKEIPVVLPVI